MQRIEIIIDRQGHTCLETKGFSGNACREASQLLEKALGAKTSERLTAEFYSQSAKQNQQIQE